VAKDKSTRTRKKSGPKEMMENESYFSRISLKAVEEGRESRRLDPMGRKEGGTGTGLCKCESGVKR